MKSLGKKDLIIIVLIAVIGLFLRLYPGSEHLIWSYDQARDSVVIRSILGERNLMIVGPQTEFFGLSHGPLYYYLLAPFYHFGQSNLDFPLMAMIVLNLSTLIPLVLLTQALFKNKKITMLAALLFVVAYQQVEYARWLSNVAITIPLLAWAYYFLWRVLKNSQHGLWAGLFLALAIQGELFLLYLIPVAYLLFYFYKTHWRSVLLFHLGLFIGLSSFLIAELKFGFLGTKVFFTEFLAGHGDKIVPAREALLTYIDHIGLTVYQNIFGLSPAMGLLLAIIGVLAIIIGRQKLQKMQLWSQVSFLIVLFFSHSVLLSFRYIDAVFLDLPILIPLVVLTALLLFLLFETKRTWLAMMLLLLFVGTQLWQLVNNTRQQTPMQTYKFHQGGILFSQKKEIVDEIYQLTVGQPFTFSVIGSPYGVQTTWATVFENYLVDHPAVTKPTWFGTQALGYPYDTYFPKVDHPEETHIVLIEDNIVELTNPKIVSDHLMHANESTQIKLEKELYGFKIQLRESTE